MATFGGFIFIMVVLLLFGSIYLEQYDDEDD